jgi:sporulation protein YlmC with PRC-barrel domain
MKATSLKGLSVIKVTTAEKIGVIEDLDFDTQSGQVTAFHIRQNQTKVTFRRVKPRPFMGLRPAGAV